MRKIIFRHLKRQVSRPFLDKPKTVFQKQYVFRKFILHFVWKTYRT